MNWNRKHFLTFAVSALILGTGESLAAPEIPQKEFTLIGEYELTTNTYFKGHKFGGLSGIIHNTTNDKYLAISDASVYKHNDGPSRIYEFKIDASSKGIKKVSIESMHLMLNPEGKPWKAGMVDGEGIAPCPDGKNYYWSSEEGPFLRIVDKQGRFVANIENILPSYYGSPTSFGSFKDTKSKEKPEGIHYNNGIEGLTITPDKKFLFTGMENALNQDGAMASTIGSSPVRISKFSIDQKNNRNLKQVGEYIYNIDPVPLIGYNKTNSNGLVELMALDDHRLLVLERGACIANAKDEEDFDIRLYLVDLSEATNVSGIPSLKKYDKINRIQPAKKTLLIRFRDLIKKSGNVEGLCLGPIIDGRPTLLFVSDNNFEPALGTKFFLFLDNGNLLSKH